MNYLSTLVGNISKIVITFVVQQQRAFEINLFIFPGSDIDQPVEAKNWWGWPKTLLAVRFAYYANLINVVRS